MQNEFSEPWEANRRWLTNSESVNTQLAIVWLMVTKSTAANTARMPKKQV
jgi:hypothetical protein